MSSVTFGIGIDRDGGYIAGNRPDIPNEVSLSQIVADLKELTNAGMSTLHKDPQYAKWRLYEVTYWITIALSPMNAEEFEKTVLSYLFKLGIATKAIDFMFFGREVDFTQVLLADYKEVKVLP